MEDVMSPSIESMLDLLGMFKKEESAVPTSTAADLEMLCTALDLLQNGAHADLNALAGCLSRLSGWLKNQPEAAPDDVSGWTSEPFGVKGIGGMITCRNDRWEVIFNQDGSGQPYLGMWQSRLPGETHHNGSFKIKAGGGETQLVLEGDRPLQVSLPVIAAAAWGSMDGFSQGLNNIHQPNPPPTDPPSSLPVQELLVHSFPPFIPDVDLSPDATRTIIAKPKKHKPLPVPLHSENSGRKPALDKQPAMIKPKTWNCACGSENTRQFCPKCGSERPAPVVKQKSAPAQPAFCRKCGKVLSIGARFCRNCGTEVRG
jgi:ribosomal protein L40E